MHFLEVLTIMIGLLTKCDNVTKHYLLNCGHTKVCYLHQPDHCETKTAILLNISKLYCIIFSHSFCYTLNNLLNMQVKTIPVYIFFNIHLHENLFCTYNKTVTENYAKIQLECICYQYRGHSYILIFFCCLSVYWYMHCDSETIKYILKKSDTIINNIMGH